MKIPRKAYRVTLGVMDDGEDLKSFEYHVMAGTVEDAIEIVREITNVKKAYIREVQLLVSEFDAD